jgi:hypothetical protein
MLSNVKICADWRRDREIGEPLVGTKRSEERDLSENDELSWTVMNHSLEQEALKCSMICAVFFRLWNKGGS